MTAVDPDVEAVAKRLGPAARPERIGPAPCTRACPAGINVKRYVGLVAEARFDEALDVIRRDNPLAAVCGYMCSRPCEVECARGADGPPIPIRALKRMAARIVADSGARPRGESQASDCGRRVAVVGGGPAGLTAARDLRRLGYGVTIVEAREQLGGLLAEEVPEARLPRAALRADIEYVLAHDIEVRLGAPVTAPDGLDALLGEGFDAVVLATGAGRDLGSGLAGERRTDSVVSALDLLRRLARGDVPELREAVVLGGNSAAFAVATELASRSGGAVSLVFRRGRAELPVDPTTLAAAQEAGVRVRCELRPDGLELGDGRLTGVAATRLVDSGVRIAGRRRLEPSQRLVIPADLVVLAEEREPNLDYLGPPDQGPSVRRTAWGTIAVQSASLETHRPRVFAAGEALTGPRSVIEMVASGRRVAAAVHGALSAAERLRKDAPLRLSRDGLSSQRSSWQHTPATPPVDAQGAHQTPFGPWETAVRPGAAVLEPAALDEARRCLRCGPCRDCRTCSSYCPETHAVEPGGVLLRMPRELAGDEALSRSLTRITARVDARRCRGCGLCEEHCPYAAPRVMLRPNGRLIASIEEQACRGCGLCVGLCPTGAADQGHFDNAYLAERTARILLREVEP
ncbi:MAG: FAD-dependent oxidoreductase [bacterium]